MTHILFTYGTLRPGKSETVKIPGTMFDLGRFPGIKLEGNSHIVCEPVEVTDWGPIDRYEGYYPDDPRSSLYIRRPLVVPYGLNGWIYEFNGDVDPTKTIESGDWLEYTQQQRGSYGNYFN